MESRQDLEALSARELHDRAVGQAVRRLDAGFLWRLLRAIPAAEAMTGHQEAVEADVTHLSALISDLIASGEGDVAQALRPLYLDYLAGHPEG